MSEMIKEFKKGDLLYIGDNKRLSGDYLRDIRIRKMA